MKRCRDGRVCGGKWLPTSEFGKNKKYGDGMQPGCKGCLNLYSKELKAMPQSQKESNKTMRTEAVAHRIAERLEAHAASRIESKHDTESVALNLYKDQCISDVLVLQAGTRADAIERPYGCDLDLWLPLQAKSTSSNVRCFKNCDGYEMDLLCFSCDSVTLYTKEFVHNNKASLHGGKNIYAGSRGKSNIWNIPTMTVEEAAAERVSRWDLEYEKYMAGEDSSLNTEQNFRLHGTKNMQKEYWQIHLSQMFDDDAEHSWADKPYAVWDRERNGVRIQDKFVTRNGLNSSYNGHVGSVNGKDFVPYIDGGLAGGYYVFGSVDVKNRLYIEWRIPESTLNSKGFLARMVEGKCTYSGRQTIPLHIATNNGSNDTLCLKIFGKLPRKPIDDWTAAFMRCYSIPPEFEMPECMCV